VINVTAKITNESDLGILFSILIVGQAKVQITTININQISAASGIIAIYFVAKTIIKIKKIAAATQDILHLQPFEILIIDCQIIAHHHIDQKNQQTVLASHCHIDSLFHLHLDSVFSSIKASVIKDSVNQIIAKTNAYGVIIYIISKNDFSITGI
jgi:hypothetical protein